MTAEGQVGDHLLVGELVPLRALDNAVQHQHIPVALTEGKGSDSQRPGLHGKGGDVPPLAQGEESPNLAEGAPGVSPGWTRGEDRRAGPLGGGWTRGPGSDVSGTGHVELGAAVGADSGSLPPR